MSNYNVIETGTYVIKAWTKGVDLAENAIQQLKNTASLPFIHKWLAVMPDAHFGMGATVGSVVATKSAIIPAAVGVDIGCGMMAVRTSLTASDLPDSLASLRSDIEAAVPVGGPGVKGSWQESGRNGPTPTVKAGWFPLRAGYEEIISRAPKIAGTTIDQLGTLGTGNHFIELCLDEAQRVWVMLHSGSRGVGNRIGMYYIEKAKEEMRRYHINLPDVDLAYLPEGSDYFDEYIRAVGWAQRFAAANRVVMMAAVLTVLQKHFTTYEGYAPVTTDEQYINCHHNYVAEERHYGDDVWVTRKGAVNAAQGAMGIIPGSMGAKSFIVRGKGNPESFNSCSHGAGRVMSRGEAKRKITVEDHARATAGVECRKDAGVLDESPAAYKDIEAVMSAQADLVEVVHTLKQVLCVKG